MIAVQALTAISGHANWGTTMKKLAPKLSAVKMLGAIPSHVDTEVSSTFAIVFITISSGSQADRIAKLVKLSEHLDTVPNAEIKEVSLPEEKGEENLLVGCLLKKQAASKQVTLIGETGTENSLIKQPTELELAGNLKKAEFNKHPVRGIESLKMVSVNDAMAAIDTTKTVWEWTRARAIKEIPILLEFLGGDLTRDDIFMTFSNTHPLQGTWAHPTLAATIISWADPTYKYKAMSILGKMLEGDVIGAAHETIKMGDELTNQKTTLAAGYTSEGKLATIGISVNGHEQPVSISEIVNAVTFNSEEIRVEEARLGQKKSIYDGSLVPFDKDPIAQKHGEERPQNHGEVHDAQHRRGRLDVKSDYHTATHNAALYLSTSADHEWRAVMSMNLRELIQHLLVQLSKERNARIDAEEKYERHAAEFNAARETLMGWRKRIRDDGYRKLSDDHCERLSELLDNMSEMYERWLTSVNFNVISQEYTEKFIDIAIKFYAEWNAGMYKFVRSGLTIGVFDEETNLLRTHHNKLLRENPKKPRHPVWAKWSTM